MICSFHFTHVFFTYDDEFLSPYRLDCQSQLTVELLGMFQQMGKLFSGLFSVLFQVYQTEYLVLIAMHIGTAHSKTGRIIVR